MPPSGVEVASRDAYRPRVPGAGGVTGSATSPSLAQSFAIPAGLGTAIAGVLALLAIAALRAHSPLAIPLTWTQTIEGLADFANAFAQARAAGVVAELGAAYYVPILIVPAAIVSHVMILGLLLRGRA